MMVTNMQKIFEMNNDLVYLRVIRLIGYYHIPIYYAFIKACIPKGKAFLLEGLKTF